MCARKPPRKVVERVLPLLKAHRSGDAAFAPLSIDEHAWFLDSCFSLLSSATGDSRARSALVEFFLTAAGAMMPYPDSDFICYQGAPVQDCLRALQSVGGPSPLELEAIAAALRSSELGSKDHELKRAVAALAHSSFRNRRLARTRRMLL